MMARLLDPVQYPRGVLFPETHPEFDDTAVFLWANIERIEAKEKTQSSKTRDRTFAVPNAIAIQEEKNDRTQHSSS
ncbi:MAG TPA: hypothetical protein DDZ80_23305 [Cyanobacteria bacterium UBA8803]|nr:hypothetical protein [Cyanobacteria bacterium UBA9273]HBL61253.1 hypothetical protein [Cyanobacteria bacterium UBA8803]